MILVFVELRMTSPWSGSQVAIFKSTCNWFSFYLIQELFTINYLYKMTEHSHTKSYTLFAILTSCRTVYKKIIIKINNSDKYLIISLLYILRAFYYCILCRNLTVTDSLTLTLIYSAGTIIHCTSHSITIRRCKFIQVYLIYCEVP